MVKISFDKRACSFTHVSPLILKHNIGVQSVPEAVQCTLQEAALSHEPYTLFTGNYELNGILSENENLLIQSEASDGNSLVRFKPVAKSTGTSLVQYKDPRTSEAYIVEVSYTPSLVPNPESTHREQIELETNDEKEDRAAKVKVAKMFASEISARVKSGEVLYIDKNTERITNENFVLLLKEVAELHKLSEVVDSPEIVALTAFYCLKSTVEKYAKKQMGFLSKFPDKLFEPGSDEFLYQCRALAKHYFIDLKKKNTSRLIEMYTNIDRELNDSGLRVIAKSFSLPNLCSFLFPGYMEGPNPPIRPWCIAYPKKWHGSEGKLLATKACQWVLKYGEKVVNQNGLFDLGAIRDKNWSEIFYKDEYDLKGMMVSCPYTRNAMDAVKLAAPQLIGLNENQIFPWDISSMKMWQEEYRNGEMLIDCVTEYIVEKYLPSQGINTLDGNKRPIPSVIKEVPNWARLYQSIVPSSLIHSKIKAVQALQRKYPELFGYKTEQIKPWEIKYTDMWSGEFGKILFRQALAYNICQSMHKAGIAEFVENEQPPRFTFSSEQFNLWYRKELVERGRDFRSFINDSGLSGGLSAVTGNNIARVVEIFFDMDSASSIIDVMSIKDQFQFVLASKGNSYTFKFNPYEFVLNPSERKQKINEVIPMLLSEFNMPFTGRYIAFIKEQGIIGGKCTDITTASRESPWNAEETRFGKILKNDQCDEHLLLVLFKELLFSNDSNQSRYHILEKILNAKMTSEEYFFDENRLRGLIKIIKDALINDINSTPAFKKEFTEVLDKILSLPMDPRQIFLPAVKFAKLHSGLTKFPVSTNILESLEEILDFALNVIIRNQTKKSRMMNI